MAPTNIAQNNQLGKRNSRQNGQTNTRPSSTSENVFDKILEKVINIDESRAKKDVQTAISETIKAAYKKEKNLRESTVTFEMNDRFDHKGICDILETHWTERRSQLPITFWRDQRSTFAQFASRIVKNSFLDYTSLDTEFPLRDNIRRANQDGEHFTRKPVRIEIMNVRGNINATKLMDIIRASIIDADASCEISAIREGKKYSGSTTRSLMFTTNGAGFRHLFGAMEGTVTYSHLATGVRARLAMRVNCRPWMCRDCFKFERHECEGKLCSQCGSKEHPSTECASMTSYCTNCSKKGHKARDLDCPTYLYQLCKEIRKFDIPIEYMEEKELRFILIKSMLIK